MAEGFWGLPRRLPAAPPPWREPAGLRCCRLQLLLPLRLLLQLLLPLLRPLWLLLRARCFLGLRDLSFAVRAGETLGIVLQDSVLFSNSLRFNVDPFAEFSDAHIWAVLRDVGLGPMMAGLPLGLASRVEEGGSNFSQGQRQLLRPEAPVRRHCCIAVPASHLLVR